MNSVLRALIYIAVDVASDYAMKRLNREPDPKAEKTAKKAKKIAIRKDKETEQ